MFLFKNFKWIGKNKSPGKPSMLFVTAFAFPFFMLIGMVILNEYHLKTSRTIVLPVEGHDPRDLLSGYYLVYKIRYGLKCPKNPSYSKGKVKAYMCFEPKKQITLFRKPKHCSFFLKGYCFSNGDFYSHGDRFYLPEQKAQEIEKLFRSAVKKSVVLSVTKKGHALAKDLLIDGKSIQSLILNEPQQKNK